MILLQNSLTPEQLENALQLATPFSYGVYGLLVAVLLYFVGQFWRAINKQNEKEKKDPIVEVQKALVLNTKAFDQQATAYNDFKTIIGQTAAALEANAIAFSDVSRNMTSLHEETKEILIKINAKLEK